jgi:hypothetical protein
MTLRPAEGFYARRRRHPQDVPQAPRRRAGAERAEPDGPPRRVPEHRRDERQWEEHLPAPARLPRRTGPGAGDARRPPHRHPHRPRPRPPAKPHLRVRLPVLPPAAGTLRARQRAHAGLRLVVRVRLVRQPEAVAVAGRGDARPRRVAAPAEAQAAGDERRGDAAGGGGAGAADEAAVPAGRRADRQPGRRDGGHHRRPAQDVEPRRGGDGGDGDAQPGDRPRVGSGGADGRREGDGGIEAGPVSTAATQSTDTVPHTSRSSFPAGTSPVPVGGRSPPDFRSAPVR